MVLRRNTKQKNIIYQAVVDMKGHVSADEVYARISGEYPTISKATVYRNLNVLYEEGKLRRIDSNFQFEERHFDALLVPHSHAICNKCGKIVDVYVAGEENLDRRITSIEDGFMLSSHELIFKGICKECREKENKNGT